MKKMTIQIIGLAIIMSLGLSIAVVAGTYNTTVCQAQKRLAELGYNPGPIDGIWGKKTESAVKEFQRNNGLVVTGEIDDSSKEKMGLQQATNQLELVHASTLYKMLMLDLAHNLVGLGWEDREREGWGREVLAKRLAEIREKYEFPHPNKNEELEIDLPEPLQGGGGGSGPTISLQVPHQWHELFAFRNWGKLPAVKYRAGSIYVALKSMKVTFTKGMKILLAGKEYTYDGAGLVAEGGVKDAPTPQKQESGGKPKVIIKGVPGGGANTAEGLFVESGQLIKLAEDSEIAGKKLAAGTQIQQYQIWNQSGKTFNKLDATIDFYDSKGSKIGTVSKQGDTLKPGWCWAFTIEAGKDVASTKVVKLVAE